jgi:hypothetical protein
MNVSVEVGESSDSDSRDLSSVSATTALIANNVPILPVEQQLTTVSCSSNSAQHILNNVPVNDKKALSRLYRCSSCRACFDLPSELRSVIYMWEMMGLITILQESYQKKSCQNRSKV